jgi:hypothetical protein
MICPDCLAKVLEVTPAIVGKAAGIIPTVGPVVGPLAEFLTKALIEALQDKDKPVTLAEFPDSGAVADRLEREWGKPLVGLWWRARTRISSMTDEESAALRFLLRERFRTREPYYPCEFCEKLATVHMRIWSNGTFNSHYFCTWDADYTRENTNRDDISRENPVEHSDDLKAAHTLSRKP